jgi:hypothetical protein
MTHKYYYLISGLPDISIEDTKLHLTAQELKKELLTTLQGEDLDIIKLFYYRYDINNVIHILKNENKPINPLGLFDAGEISDEIKRIKEEGAQSKSSFPMYLQEFIGAYVNGQLESLETTPENHLLSLYFQYAIEHSNTFISGFFQTELNVLNFLTATYLRKHNLEYVQEIVGESETANLIKKSSAKDFNLSGEFEWANALLQITETNDIVEREKRTDALRWEYVDNMVFFNYFTVERIFAYLVKVDILERWASLTKEKGKSKFEDVLEGLQSSYEFPEEYLKK